MDKKERQSSLRSHQTALRKEGKRVQTSGVNARAQKVMGFEDKKRVQIRLPKLGRDMGGNDRVGW